MVKSEKCVRYYKLVIKCDECTTQKTVKVPIVQRWQDEPTYETAALNRKLRAAGWYVTKRRGSFYRNLCPSCSEKPKPKGYWKSKFIKSKEKQNEKTKI